MLWMPEEQTLLSSDFLTCSKAQIIIINLFIEGSLIISGETVLPKGPLWCNADSLFYEDGLLD